MNTISQLNDHYQTFISAHPHAEQDFIEAVEDVLTDAGLAYDRVSARVKDWRSLKTKAQKRRADNSLVYPDPWEDINDVVGVRVTTYHSTEIPHVITALAEMFEIKRSIDKTEQTRVAGNFGYGSHHLILGVDPRVKHLHDAYQDFSFEVQIRTVLQHAWAEFEHDIRYKRRSGEIDPQIDRAFTLAAGLIELADQQFDLIAQAEKKTSSGTDVDGGMRFTAKTLPGMIAMMLGNDVPQSKLASYQWLEELLHANQITTVAQLRDLLDESALGRVRQAMAYRFQPGQVRIIDDLLLDRFGIDHIKRTENIGDYITQRADRLHKRLTQLRNTKP